MENTPQASPRPVRKLVVGAASVIAALSVVATGLLLKNRETGGDHYGTNIGYGLGGTAGLVDRESMQLGNSRVPKGKKTLAKFGQGGAY